VVHKDVPIEGLRLDQARNIFTGRVGTWSKITGDPVEVRVVGRGEGSGTRLTLERHVLGIPAQAAPTLPTSDDCEKRRQGAENADAIVCERGTTSDVLNRIAAVKNTIGYADVGDVTRKPGVKPISLNGQKADLDSIRDGYPFWTIEYVYSYGEVKDGSLAEAFIDYLSSYLLAVQNDAENSASQPDYFACDATLVRELCDREER
jgi:phosphate transport system substrate-binding protein